MIPLELDNKDIPSDDILIHVIESMYRVPSQLDTVDFIKHADLVASVRELFPDTRATDVYRVMMDIGFDIQTIEGTLYWRVASV